MMGILCIAVGDDCDQKNKGGDCIRRRSLRGLDDNEQGETEVEVAAVDRQRLQTNTSQQQVLTALDLLLDLSPRLESKWSSTHLSDKVGVYKVS